MAGDLTAMLQPLAHDEAVKAQCRGETFVYNEIIHVLMLFVSVLISGIALKGITDALSYWARRKGSCSSLQSALEDLCIGYMSYDMAFVILSQL